MERLSRLNKPIGPFRQLAAYSVYAVQLRYDGGPKVTGHGMPLDRAQALADARTLFDHVHRIIQELDRTA